MHDRGNIKWAAMMLPEHNELLKDFWKQQEYKEKPTLDEQQAGEINMKLQLAIHNDLTVRLTYFAAHDYKEITGKISKIDSIHGLITINADEPFIIRLADLLNVTID
ncbi:YolD-like family protein [Oceanobacillus massiliensis]|uniref:YolD-like family protein n=1 Tax=Oceanobacillus massiliensis TaxID=1465765 RepID=UPI0030166CDD